MSWIQYVGGGLVGVGGGWEAEGGLYLPLELVMYRFYYRYCDNLDLSYQLSISILQWLASIFIISAMFTTIITWIINILNYIQKFMAYNVQALQSISLVHVQKACLPVLLTLEFLMII